MTTLSNTAWIEQRARHEFLALVGLLIGAAADIGWYAALTLS
jgi:hypothetical protein